MYLQSMCTILHRCTRLYFHSICVVRAWTVQEGSGEKRFRQKLSKAILSKLFGKIALTLPCVLFILCVYIMRKSSSLHKPGKGRGGDNQSGAEYRLDHFVTMYMYMIGQWARCSGLVIHSGQISSSLHGLSCSPTAIQADEPYLNLFVLSSVMEPLSLVPVAIALVNQSPFLQSQLLHRRALTASMAARGTREPCLPPVWRDDRGVLPADEMKGT